MKKQAIIYSFRAKKTGQIAQKIVRHFGKHNLEILDADTLTEKEFLKYDFLILGVPTWFDGELPNYWDEFVPALEDMDLSGKEIALFGLGDQVGYPENFCDGIGILAAILKERGAKIAGKWPLDGYDFESSKAVENNFFLGLPLDQENQSQLTEKRINDWVKLLIKK